MSKEKLIKLQQQFINNEFPKGSEQDQERRKLFFDHAFEDIVAYKDGDPYRLLSNIKPCLEDCRHCNKPAYHKFNDEIKNYDTIPNLRFDIITKTQNPKLERITTKRSIKHFRVLYLQTKYVLDGIANNIFYANPSWRCIDCEHRNTCWFWNGEALPLPKAA